MSEQARPRFLGLDANAWIYIGVAMLLSGEVAGFVYRGAHPELTYGQWQATPLYLVSNVISLSGFVPLFAGVVLRWRRVSTLPEEQRRRVYKRLAILLPVLLIVLLVPAIWVFASQPR